MIPRWPLSRATIPLARASCPLARASRGLEGMNQLGEAFFSIAGSLIPHLVARCGGGVYSPVCGTMSGREWSCRQDMVPSVADVSECGNKKVGSFSTFGREGVPRGFHRDPPPRPEVRNIFVLCWGGVCRLFVGRVDVGRTWQELLLCLSLYCRCSA